MSRRVLYIATAASAALGVTPVAHAEAKGETITVPFRETERSVAITTETGFPAVGTRQLGAAVIATKAFGKGDKGQLFHLTSTAPPAPGMLGFTLVGSDFFSDGTQRWRAKGSATIAADGTLTAKGTGGYVGGSGRYRGARGTFTLRSTQRAGSPVTITKSKGHVTF